jgi:Domain of unknown function (DUF4365)
LRKTITSNQLLGEIGEAAVRLRFLNMGFQFDGRSRLEAGVDGIAEVMDQGKPLARMIAVQVKATESSRYTSEDETGFSYLLRPDDLTYWRGSNLPIILVLYRKSDKTYFWKEVGVDIKGEERRLRSVKEECLCKVILFGERSLRRALSEYVEHFHGKADSRKSSARAFFMSSPPWGDR